MAKHAVETPSYGPVCEDITLPSGKIVGMHRPNGYGIVHFLSLHDNETIPDEDIKAKYEFAVNLLTLVTELSMDDLMKMYDLDLEVLIKNMSRFLPSVETKE
jgi:hypothetical protein